MTAPTQTISGVPADTPDVLVETRRAIAWDAVIAGSLIGLAISICLSIAGAAFGFSLVDPYEGTPSPRAFGVGAIIWMFIVSIAGMGAGGYVAGRGAMTETTMDEADYRYRCAAHGLTVWAISTVLAGLLGMSMAVGALGFAANTATSVAGGGAAGMAMNADDDMGDIGFHVRQLFGPQVAPGQGRSTQSAASAAAPPAAGQTAPTGQSGQASQAAQAGQPPGDYGDDAMDEAGYILVRAWQRNGLEASEKTYLAGVLARHNGISQAEAEQKVGEAEQRLKAAMAKAEAEAKEAADKASKAAALASLMAFLSLAIGAIAAVVGALSWRTRGTTVVNR